MGLYGRTLPNCILLSHLEVYVSAYDYFLWYFAYKLTYI